MRASNVSKKQLYYVGDINLNSLICEEKPNVQKSF